MAVYVNGKEVDIDTVTSGITASTTRSQGNGALVSGVNEISIVANPSDTVTLPTAVAGRRITIINNGANTLQIFPASGDNLGTGVDASTELEPNESIDYVAYDINNWHVEASTEIFHAEMYDSDNGDPYVINVVNDSHMYHSNGIQAGDLAGWTFDAGGGGTSFAIASIANSPGSPGAQAEITTTLAHGLVAGAIVSLTNMSAGTNTGTHVVLAPVTEFTFEIATLNFANATGTMDEAATLIAKVGSAGQYLVLWAASAAGVGANETFDFAVHVGAVHQASTNTRRKFGGGGDVGVMGGVSIITIADGSKVSFMLTNISSGADITLRDFTLVLVRL